MVVGNDVCEQKLQKAHRHTHARTHTTAAQVHSQKHQRRDENAGDHVCSVCERRKGRTVECDRETNRTFIGISSGGGSIQASSQNTQTHTHTCSHSHTHTHTHARVLTGAICLAFAPSPEQTKWMPGVWRSLVLPQHCRKASFAAHPLTT